MEIISSGMEHDFHFFRPNLEIQKQEDIEMKKALAWLLTLALALCAAGACAEEEALTFESLAGLEWSFSSGAGGWSTEMRLDAEGAFSGEFHDSEMGEMDDAYPHGTLYGCSFTGRFTPPEPVDEYSWVVRVDSLTIDGTVGEESIDDGIRYVTTDPYGISEGDEMRLFRPGTPVDMLNEDMQMWAHLLWQEEAPTELEDWFLYSAANESGFVGYSLDDMGMENPWVELTEEELSQVSGVAFNVPEGAENVVWRWLADESLAEMQFTLDGDEYCARIKPDALEAGQLDNISGIYYEWEHEEEISVGGCYGTIGIAHTGSQDWVELCLWYDLVPGLMYSLSAYTTDPDGLDVVAVAEMVYAPMQGDA